MTEQIRRIIEMEQYLDRSLDACAKLQAALDTYEETAEEYLKLAEYYGSTAWMEDFEADEAGKLPADLKRGVLSEDAVYNLITDTKEIKKQMLRILARIVE